MPFSEPPVRFIEPDRTEPRAPEPGTALCPAGGGYRAMLFHLGALKRLNEVGYLTKLKRVSSVSGGSITAGVLAMNWKRLRIRLERERQGRLRWLTQAEATKLLAACKKSRNTALADVVEF